MWNIISKNEILSLGEKRMKRKNWKPFMVLGLVSMFGIMTGAMIVIMMMFSGMGGIGQWMWGVMIFPFLGILIMLVIMLFFFRKMAKKGGLMSGMMGHSHNPQLQLKENDMTTITYNIPAVNCDHCKMTIEREVGKLPGVSSVNVDVGSKQAVIKLVTTATKAEIEALLSEIGYPPESQ